VLTVTHQLGDKLGIAICAYRVCSITRNVISPKFSKNATSRSSALILRHVTASARFQIFILTSKDISVGAKLAYAMLLKYAWNNDACFPGQVALAGDTGRPTAASGHI
jgi:hypothetical protein